MCACVFRLSNLSCVQLFVCECLCVWLCGLFVCFLCMRVVVCGWLVDRPIGCVCVCVIVCTSGVCVLVVRPSCWATVCAVVGLCMLLVVWFVCLFSVHACVCVCVCVFVCLSVCAIVRLFGCVCGWLLVCVQM